MSANFTPELQPFKDMRPFRFWCQKVLPLVYDDSLSYYEVLCKLLSYLNDMITSLEGLHQDVTDLKNAFEQLQEYVNNYFDNLDLQEEVNNYLDTHIQELLSGIKYYDLPEKYGAMGDGVNNDTEAFNSCISNCKEHNLVMYLMPGKTYLLEPIILNGITLYGNMATVKMTTQTSTVRFLTLTGEGTNIHDLIVIGDQDTHTPESEQIHGVYIIDANKVLCENIFVTNTMGDGFYIGGFEGESSNINLVNCACDKVYRNGISIVWADNVSIDRFVGKNIQGTEPMACITIEGNNNTNNTTNINIGDVVCENTSRGVGITCRGNELSGHINNVYVKNIKSYPLVVTYSEVNDNSVTYPNSGNIFTVDSVIGNTEAEIFGSFNRWNGDKCPLFVLNNANIYNCDNLQFIYQLLVDRQLSFTTFGHFKILNTLFYGNSNTRPFELNNVSNIDKNVGDVVINIEGQLLSTFPVDNFTHSMYECKYKGLYQGLSNIYNGFNYISEVNVNLRAFTNDFVIITSESNISFTLQSNISDYTILINGNEYASGTNLTLTDNVIYGFLVGSTYYIFCSHT